MNTEVLEKKDMKESIVSIGNLSIKVSNKAKTPIANSY